VAIDTDPMAVGAAEENLGRNGVGAVTASAELSTATGTFELVLANIQADVLLGLRADLAWRVAPGGALVLSGLLTEQVDDVAQAYEGAGLRRAKVDVQGDWGAVVLFHP
jgi:ribosomal protein L11 methyltransferase